MEDSSTTIYPCRDALIGGTCCGQTELVPRRPHRPLALDASHWREDGQPKVRYTRQADALMAADERSKEAGTELGVYECPFCKGWHMGRRAGRAGGLDA
jgi:hypothetical protein